MKNYNVEVFTGDVLRAGTDSNVFITLFGDFGDSGEKKLVKSETHVNKFERNQVFYKLILNKNSMNFVCKFVFSKMDRFQIQTADLGRLFKIKIRHDDSAMMSSDWFLDRVEVNDGGREKSVFLCERWLSKSKEDKQIERVLFEKNYKGPKGPGSSSQLLKSNIAISHSGSHEQLSLRQQSPNSARNYDDSGPTISYAITIRTGDERNQGNSGQVFIRLIGENKRLKTNRINLQLAKRKRFEPGREKIIYLK